MTSSAILPFHLPFDVITPTDCGKSNSQLFSDLNEAVVSKSKRGRARKRFYPLWDNPDIKLTGWSFQEFDYGKPNIKLASNARGLFSLQTPTPSHDNTTCLSEERIVARGYDKFFNVGELPFLKWPWIEANSDGHFEVTSKENGCIIFMSGLEDGTLIVTSKKSTGPLGDKPEEEIHSFAGLKWVRKHLASKHIDEQKFAKLLFQMNVTAVGELCDDAFEEHVLAYPTELSGIYLHGLNLNTDRFFTYPFSNVEAFAKMFGFLTTDYLLIDGVDNLKNFLETCAETGTWKNREVEGFVIRSKFKLVENDTNYFDYFFKYKFEEPYLMYRQWRELTKAHLSGKSRVDMMIKKNVYYTNKYLDFVIPLSEKDPALKDRYQRNHGIIELRQKFLNHVGISGSKIVELEQELAQKDIQNAVPNYILVPVATIGCGKTTISVALNHLFPSWRHVQNDEIKRSPKPINFASSCMEWLRQTSNVVIADRNNHQKRERQQLFDDMNKLNNTQRKNVYLCLNFRPDLGCVESKKSSIKDVENKIWDITTKRVIDRGDNHQTIAANSIDRGKLISIMKGFVSRFEYVDVSSSPDDQFDLVIDLDHTSTNSSRNNLDIIIKSLHENYPQMIPTIPSKQQVDEAFDFALKYIPSAKASVKQKKKSPRYYAVRIDVDELEKGEGSSIDKLSESFEDVSITKDQKSTKASQTKSYASVVSTNTPTLLGFAKLIDRMFLANPSADGKIWKSLQQNNRVQSEFHVTLAHKSSVSDADAKLLFEGYKKVYEDAANALEQNTKNKPQQQNTRKPKSDGSIMDLPGLEVDIVLKNLCFDSEILAVEVDLSNPRVLDSKSSESADSKAKFEIGCCNQAPHITIGTINSSVAAVQAGRAIVNNKKDLVKIPWNIEPRVLKAQHVAAYY